MVFIATTHRPIFADEQCAAFRQPYFVFLFFGLHTNIVSIGDAVVDLRHVNVWRISWINKYMDYRTPTTRSLMETRNMRWLLVAFRSDMFVCHPHPKRGREGPKIDDNSRVGWIRIDKWSRPNAVFVTRQNKLDKSSFPPFVGNSAESNRIFIVKYLMENFNYLLRSQLH